MPKKILIHLPNNPGGKVNYFEAIKDHFEHDVTFFLCGSQGRKESKWRLFVRMLQDFRNFNRLVRDGGFDLVHTNPTLNLKSFFRDSIFTLISCRAGVKTLVFWHGWLWAFEKKVVRRIKFYFNQTYGRADAMIFLAREFSEKTREYGYRKKVFLETTVIEDTILDFERAPAAAKGKDHRTILFLSRVEKAKGIFELLEGFGRLRKQFPDLVLQIAGNGNEFAGAQAYVTERQLPGVQFLGWVNGREKARIFQEADLFVLPSYSEGMPCSLLEAMASGLPVVTTDVGGIKDFFEEGEMGFFIRPKDSADLEEKIGSLLSDPVLRQKMGAYNQHYAHSNFTPAQVCRRLENIYERIIAVQAAGVETVKN